MITDRKQKLLPFDSDSETKEQQRQERIKRLLGTDKRITTADKVPYFDFEEATKIATQVNRRNGQC
jgi:hypothetical protein